jgi:DNA-binding transcriptional MerR regulator
MRIAEFAKALGVSPATLRRLERRGMIRPRRDWTGARRFTETDLARTRELLFEGPPPRSKRGRGKATP